MVMNIILICGIAFITFGLITVIRGRIPFIKTYNGVKNDDLF